MVIFISMKQLLYLRLMINKVNFMQGLISNKIEMDYKNNGKMFTLNSQ